MENRNIELKYEILKTRVTALIDEHADALALAQMFRNELERTKNNLREMEQKLSMLEGKIQTNDIQEKDRKDIITRESMVSSEH